MTDERECFIDWFCEQIENGNDLPPYQWDDGSVWSFFCRNIGEGSVIYMREESGRNIGGELIDYNRNRDLSSINGYSPFAAISWQKNIYCYNDRFCAKNKTISFDKAYHDANKFVWESTVPELYRMLPHTFTDYEKEQIEKNARTCLRKEQLGIPAKSGVAAPVWQYGLDDDFSPIDTSLFNTGDFEETLFKLRSAKDTVLEKLKDGSRDCKIELANRIKELREEGVSFVTEEEKKIAHVFSGHLFVNVYLALDDGSERCVNSINSHYLLNDLIEKEPLLWTLNNKRVYGFEHVCRIEDQETGEVFYSKSFDKEQEEEEERC